MTETPSELKAKEKNLLYALITIWGQREVSYHRTSDFVWDCLDRAAQHFHTAFFYAISQNRRIKIGG